MREHFGKLQGLKFAYMGDARYNMGNSLMIGCAKMGLHFVACAPKAYWPDPALVEKCKEFAPRQRRQHHAERGHRRHGRCGCRLHRRLGQHG